MADLTAWRELVTKELAGASFDKLVQRTPEGIAIEPLYVERPAEAPGARDAAAWPWKLCTRLPPGADAAAELDAGADALWCSARDHAAIDTALARGRIVVIEPPATDLDGLATDELDDDTDGDVWIALDRITEVARGNLPPHVLDGRSGLVPPLKDAIASDSGGRWHRISTLPFHEAGADAADELALGLSSLVASLRELDDAGLDLGRASRLMWAQVSVGRDTFGEVCKLRALRVLWRKVLGAAGVAGGALDAIHAVCSARTLSQRDPWVNMLRVTTQVFAAALGGAHLITPLAFDAAFASPSALGQRIARNTALVLREESQLGRVADAAGGSYYIESRTDALAREAWSRFTEIERTGGVVQLLRAGKLHARLEAAWTARAQALAKRKEPVLGVSEFPNLREQLPGVPVALAGVHRDAEAFEALRARVDEAPRSVGLALLGPPAEHRARVGFAENLFSVAGLSTAPLASGAAVDIACICGSDERYATEAANTARSLKAAGATRVVLAGRPGALEAELRAAGVDAFIFVGCDVLATFEELLS